MFVLAFVRKYEPIWFAKPNRISSHKSKLESYFSLCMHTQNANLALLVVEFWSDALFCISCSSVTSNEMLCIHLAQRVMKNGFYGQCIILLCYQYGNQYAYGTNMLIGTTHSVVNLEQSYPTGRLWDFVAYRTVSSPQDSSNIR